MKLVKLGPNQTELHLYDGRVAVLVSYETPVACRINGLGSFRTNKYWSRTTQKHIKQWMLGVPELAPVVPQALFDGLVSSNGATVAQFEPYI